MSEVITTVVLGEKTFVFAHACERGSLLARIQEAARRAGKLPGSQPTDNLTTRLGFVTPELYIAVGLSLLSVDQIPGTDVPMSAVDGLRVPTMVPVSSSNVVAVGYDEVSRCLFVRFMSGMYYYKEVPPEVYADVMNATSVGKACGTLLRNKFAAVPWVECA